jgi:hypothetical protein
MSKTEPDTDDSQQTTDRTDCMRCGDPLGDSWSDTICDTCKKHIQRKALREGVRCPVCDGYGEVHSTYCDVQRAMNGRDQQCPECNGTGKQKWEPDPEDVHPDLRYQVVA